MGRNRAIWNRHPVWSVFLLMAADAERTGLTAETAKSELARLMPSVANDLDGILAAQGDLDRMNGEVEAATALAITDEAHALGADVPRHRGSGESAGDGEAVNFSDQLRHELRTPRGRRIVVPNGDGGGEGTP